MASLQSSIPGQTRNDDRSKTTIRRGTLRVPSVACATCPYSIMPDEDPNPAGAGTTTPSRIVRVPPKQKGDAVV